MPKNAALKKQPKRRRVVEEDVDGSEPGDKQKYEPTKDDLEENVPVEQMSDGDYDDDEDNDDDDAEEEKEEMNPPPARKRGQAQPKKKRAKKAEPAVQEKDEEEEEAEDEFAVKLSKEELEALEASEKRAQKILDQRRQGKDGLTHDYLQGHTPDEKTQDLTTCHTLLRETEQQEQGKLRDKLREKLTHEDEEKLTAEMAQASAYGDLSQWEVARRQARLQESYFANLGDDFLKEISFWIRPWNNGTKTGHNITLQTGTGRGKRVLRVTGPPMPITRFTGPPFFNWSSKCDPKLPHKSDKLRDLQYYVQSTCEPYDEDNKTEADTDGQFFDKESKAFYDFVHVTLRDAVLKKLLQPPSGPGGRKKEHTDLLAKVRSVLQDVANLNQMQTTDIKLMERARKEQRGGHGAKRRRKSEEQLKEIQQVIDDLVNKGQTEEAQAYMEKHGDPTLPGTEMVEASKDAFMNFKPENWEAWRGKESNALDARIAASPWFKSLWDDPDTRLMLRVVDVRRGDDKKLPWVPLSQQEELLKPGCMAYITYTVNLARPKSANSAKFLGISLEPHCIVVVGQDDRFAHSSTNQGPSEIVETEERPAPVVNSIALPKAAATNNADLMDAMQEAKASMRAAEAEARSKAQGK